MLHENNVVDSEQKDKRTVRSKDFLKGRRREELSAEELRAVEDLISEVRTVPARHNMIVAGEPVDFSTLLLEGTMCRYMDDRQGMRQLVALQVPGDFVDLHAFPLKYLDHDVATITECQVAIVPHSALERIMEKFPHLARMLWFSTLLDAAMHREWIFRLGRLDAAGRIAHFFAEINVRLHLVGRSDGNSFTLPITQNDLAEALGMTTVHVNRVLRDLREQGVLTFRGGLVKIDDVERLHRIAEFESRYLFTDTAAI